MSETTQRNEDPIVDLEQGISRRLENGDDWHEVLEDFVLEHPAVQAGIHARVKNRGYHEPTEQLSDRALSKFWQGMRNVEFVNIKNVVHYFNRAMTNAVLSVFREETRQQGNSSALSAEVIDSYDAQIWEEREREVFLRGELGKLPPTPRRVFTLVLFEKMRYTEVAAQLALTRGRISQIIKKYTPQLEAAARRWREDGDV